MSYFSNTQDQVGDYKMRMIRYWFIMMFVFVVLTGFDFSKHSIPLEEIHDGGPAKDGIPALYDPEFISASKVNYLKDRDRILGLELNGETRAYPIKILNWHELVNDQVGDEAVLISYCPLCGTGMAFNAKVHGHRKLFGVSGKLYNSDVLFYDKQTESLWSQIKMQAVTGSFTGTTLQQIVLEHTTWRAWVEKHPDTKVLSIETGYFREYERSPYHTYENNNAIYFPVSHEDKRLQRKDWVLGVNINAQTKAYPFKVLEKTNTPFVDQVGGQEISIHYDSTNRSAWVEKGEEMIPSTQAYWFAWIAFHPDTKLHGE